jgi:hypothetical protein
MRYNLDLGIKKDTRFTERKGAELVFRAFNVPNHMEWCDPGVPRGAQWLSVFGDRKKTGMSAGLADESVCPTMTHKD